MVTQFRRNIIYFVKKVYYAYFEVEFGDQDKPWAPHNVCYVYLEDLWRWYKGKQVLQMYCSSDMERATKKSQ